MLEQVPKDGHHDAHPLAQEGVSPIVDHAHCRGQRLQYLPLIHLAIVQGRKALPRRCRCAGGSVPQIWHRRTLPSASYFAGVIRSDKTSTGSMRGLTQSRASPPTQAPVPTGDAAARARSISRHRNIARLGASAIGTRPSFALVPSPIRLLKISAEGTSTMLRTCDGRRNERPFQALRLWHGSETPRCSARGRGGTLRALEPAARERVENTRGHILELDSEIPTFRPVISIQTDDAR